MSIEKLLGDLTEALNANTEAQNRVAGIWEKLHATAKEVAANATTVTAAGVEVAKVKAETVPPKADAKKPPKAAKTAPAADTPPVTEGATDAATENASESLSDGPTLEQISDRVNKLAKTNRAQVVEALKGYGAKRTPDLKPEQYAPFMADLDAIENPDEGSLN